MRNLLLGLLLSVVFALAPRSAVAQTLTIGAAVPISSIDPHFHNFIPNIAAARHIFDSLILQDARQHLIPGLATEWSSIDDKTWEFKLRSGVTWHDGSPFTADDVVFTLARAPAVPNSPGTFKTFTRFIDSVAVIDPLTIRIRTTQVYPLLPNDLSQILIISRAKAEGRATEAFNSGEAAIGTGPYKYARWISGDRLELDRNDHYWGKKQPWEHVIIRYITSPGSRVAALLAEDVDLIDAVPTTDVERLRADPEVDLFETPSNRIVFLNVDSGRRVSPYATDANGAPLNPNPLQDVRVRRALTLAIDRELIVSRVMEGNAAAAGQLVPPSFFGANPSLKPPKIDTDRAKALLAEAGYANGFTLTLHSPNDRYVNDARIAQAIGQMLSKAGLNMKVETMPYSVLGSKANARNPDVSLTLSAWGSASGEPSVVMTAALQTYNREKGTGSSNRGRYHSPTFDRLLDEAKTTIDDEKRSAHLQEAMRIAIEQDVAIIPLHYQVNIWASKGKVTYEARTDESTLAMAAKPAQ